MDIHFCDECGNRVTDLDLRAGKGMRKRFDTICSACVDQGLAGSWLARLGQGAPAAAMARAGGASLGAGSVAVADPPDIISQARDRARTQPDDPFAVDEPAPLQPLPKPSTETDAIPAKPVVAKPIQAKQEAPLDGLAAAGGGFGALVGAGMPPPPPGLVDDPEESDKDLEVADPPPVADADSPFDFVHPKNNDNPGKAETAEVAAVGPKDETRAAERPSRTASDRHQSPKRGSTSTSKRTAAAKPSSTRRSGTSRRKGNKVILFSLISCTVMLVIFGLVLANRHTGRPERATVTDLPLTELKNSVDQAKRDSNAAMGSDDLPTIERAIASVRRMQDEFKTFQGKAKGWNEDAHSEELRILGYYDVMSTLRDLNNRRVIVEQRGH